MTVEIESPEKAASKKLNKFKRAWESNENSRGSSAEFSFQDIPKYNDEELCILELLGQGAFSNVFKVFDKRNSNSMLAIKRLQPHFVQNGQIQQEDTIKKVLSVCAADQVYEAAILSKLHHDNVIALRGIIDGNIMNHLKNGTFFVALDPLQNQTLEERLEDWRSSSPSKRGLKKQVVTQRIKDIALGMAKGMEYIHSKRILYRDLKPANIGFEERTNRVKIFDFGLSRVLRKDEDETTLRNLTMRVGTPRYMAPEIVMENDTYSFPVDIYSFSIIVWQVLTNQLAFAEVTSYDDLKARIIQNPRVRPSLKFIKSDSIKSLFESAWSENPSKRPTFAEIRKALEDIITGKSTNISPSITTAEETNITAEVEETTKCSLLFCIFNRKKMQKSTAAATKSYDKDIISTTEQTKLSSNHLDLLPNTTTKISNIKDRKSCNLTIQSEQSFKEYNTTNEIEQHQTSKNEEVEA